MAAIPLSATRAVLACADALRLVRWYSEVVGTWGSLVDHSQLKLDVDVAIDQATDEGFQSKLGAKPAVDAFVGTLKLHLTTFEDVRLPRVDAMWADPSIMPGAILVLTRQFAIDTFNMTRGNFGTDKDPLTDTQRNTLRMMDEALSMEEDGRSDFVHRVGTSVSAEKLTRFGGKQESLYSQFIRLATAVVESRASWTVTRQFENPPPQRELVDNEDSRQDWAGLSLPVIDYEPAARGDMKYAREGAYHTEEGIITLVFAQGSYLRQVTNAVTWPEGTSIFRSYDQCYRDLVKCQACGQVVALSLELASPRRTTRFTPVNDPMALIEDDAKTRALREWQALARAHEHRLIKPATSGRSMPESGRAARLQAALKRHP